MEMNCKPDGKGWKWNVSNIYEQHHQADRDIYNNVLLVKTEGPVWYTIYHQTNLLLKGVVQTPY